MQTKGRVLVTGATGFAGANIVPMLIAAGHDVRACGRNERLKPAHCEFVALDLAKDVNLDGLVSGCDAVLHLAGRAHVMKEDAANPLAEFRMANFGPTLRLVEAALRNNIGHFIFTSSVKVHGEISGPRPIREDDPLLAEDAYGISKIEAERAIMKACAGNEMSTTILRLPLVYGPGVKGNVFRLAKLVATGIPLPFSTSANLRSMLNVDNLGSAILALLDRPAAGCRTFLLSDGHDISTADLVRYIAAAEGRSARLFPFPRALLRLGATVAGFGGEFERLDQSLQIDTSRIREALGWNPPFSMEDGMAKTVNAMNHASNEGEAR